MSPGARIDAVFLPATSCDDSPPLGSGSMCVG
jgi:hypothetical protein